MSWCDVCQTNHSSMSCYHPASVRIAELEATLARVKNVVPHNWLDPLLTGPDRVIDEHITPVDIERLLNAINKRLQAALGGEE